MKLPKLLYMQAILFRILPLISLFFYSIAVAQPDPFAARWSQVDSLEDQNLTRSALERVERIYVDARRLGAQDHQIKAFLHRLKYQSRIEPKSDSINVAQMQAEIEQSEGAVRSVLLAYLAGQYAQYYQRNRYRILGRSELAEQNEDFQTWDVARFHRTITMLHLVSLENAETLQAIPVRDFDAILFEAKESPDYRPTLYDLLAHRALDYFMSPDFRITQPGQPFELEAETYLVAAADFIPLSLESSDSLSWQWQSLRVFQRLLRFHQAADQETPFLDTELKRLRYVRQNAIGAEKDSLYLQQLEGIINRYPKNELTAEAYFAKASLFVERADRYQPNDPLTEAYRWDRKSAWEICQEAIRRYPKSRGAGMCRSLVSGIEQPELNLQIEQVQMRKQAFPLRISYRNLEQVYLRVVRLSPELQALERNRDFREKVLAASQGSETQTHKLSASADYQGHSTLVAIDAKRPGAFAILASSSSAFNPKADLIELARTQVTRIAHFLKTNAEGQTELYVRDRSSGKPLAGVQVTSWLRDYRDPEAKAAAEGETDENGYLLLEKRERGYVELELRYKRESFRTERIYSYAYGNPGEEVPSQQTVFFTDRKIYRPGQTIYFKALVMEQKGTDHRIKAQHPVKITFYDVNNQVIQSLELRTNAYGSVQGSFIAPTSGLTGNMRLEAEGGATSISVEEYKRPKFEVNFNPVAGTYKLGETVNISGLAQAYAGNNLDGAQVSYRVVREVQFPYFYFFWRRPQPSSPSQEILNGTGLTDREGKFEIEFPLTPDRSVPESQKPVFTYTVYAEVTDLNGESHSAQTSLRAGYVSVLLSASVPEQVSLTDLPKIAVSATNLNGQSIDLKGSATIYPLDMPDRPLRELPWEPVDQPMLNESEFRQRFPHIAYRDENEEINWPKRQSGQWDLSFNTGTETGSKVDLAPLVANKPGRYRLELQATDPATGAGIEVIRFFSLLDPEAKRLAEPEYLSANLSAEQAEPGETLTLTLGTATKKVWLVYELSQGPKRLDRRFIRLKGKQQQRIRIPIDESYRGNIQLSVASIKHNAFHQVDQEIRVPWSNKQLKLSWETFRDKLLPGQQEQWKLKISGPQGEAVGAELVASLYDASLDAFRANNFSLSLYPTYRYWSGWQVQNSFGTRNSYSLSERNNTGYRPPAPRMYDQLNDFGFLGGRGSGGIYPAPRMQRAGRAEPSVDAMVESEAMDLASAGVPTEEAAAYVTTKDAANGEEETQMEPGGGVPIRTNLQETAFFFPQLETDAEGNIILNFTMPEALTRWKFLGLAHTKDLAIGTLGGSTVTQKDLMVFPNVSRFLREGDEMRLSAKVSNLSENDLSGLAELRLLDAFTRKPVAAAFALAEANQSFTVPAGQSVAVHWSIKVPKTVQAVAIQVVARAGDFSDGEENTLPVVKNRMLVTESIPLAVRGKDTKQYVFRKLLSADTSATLQHQQLTLEFSSNPAWYAVQALPYLMEFPHACTEQIFSRYYANALASHIANQHPRIQQVFEQWRQQALDPGAEALLSNLEKNQELKLVLLEETPWVLDARDESERKRRVGMLFDLNRMADEASRTWRQLAERQNASGAFSWFPGMRDSRYITQLLMTGLGHLQKLGVGSPGGDPEMRNITQRAIAYLDGQIQQDYQRLIERKRDLKLDNLGYTHIQYLYMRSFFPDIPVAEAANQAYQYYYGQAKSFWPKKGYYAQGMLSLALHRGGDQPVGQAITRALAENAVRHEERGMYWKDAASGWFWYQAPIERQALLIESFDEVAGDEQAVSDLKLWLLRNKRTNDWKSTRATANATYALLATGEDWLASQEMVDIRLGGEQIKPEEQSDTQVEAGTGYFKLSWPGEQVKPELGRIQLRKEEPGLAWGALYWQYFENLDKITFAETPLSLRRELFKVENTDRGPQLMPITAENPIRVGDRVRARVELRVDQAMEYVHLKDMRAAAFEPMEVLSSYRYQAGLGYYQSTRDVATHFFFDYLPPGTHVFEYTLVATQAGDFSHGISSIQCMYAPEFTSHSEGMRVKVEE